MFTLKEVSKILKVSTKTLYRWIKKKSVSYTKIGCKYYFTEEQLKNIAFAYDKDFSESSENL